MSRRVQCSFIDKFSLWHVSGRWSRCYYMCIRTPSRTQNWQSTSLLPFPPVIPPVCPSAEERCQLFWLGASMYQVPSQSCLLWACLLSVLLSKAYTDMLQRASAALKNNNKTLLTQNMLKINASFCFFMIIPLNWHYYY